MDPCDPELLKSSPKPGILKKVLKHFSRSTAPEDAPSSPVLTHASTSTLSRPVSDPAA